MGHGGGATDSDDFFLFCYLFNFLVCTVNQGVENETNIELATVLGFFFVTVAVVVCSVLVGAGYVSYVKSTGNSTGMHNVFGGNMGLLLIYENRQVPSSQPAGDGPSRPERSKWEGYDSYWIRPVYGHGVYNGRPPLRKPAPWTTL